MAHNVWLTTHRRVELAEANERISAYKLAPAAAHMLDELCDELSERLQPEVVLELMMLANAYGVVRLEQLCARKLAARLDACNVADIAQCANLIGESYLLRAAQKFECARLDAVNTAAPQEVRV